MPDTIKDWRGTPIEVGDVILYAVKHSTSVEVNEASVVEIGFGEEDWNGKPTPFVVADWHHSSECYRPGYDDRLTSYRHIKRVKLTNFEGITVVAKHKAPAFAKDLPPVRWVGGVT